MRERAALLANTAELESLTGDVDRAMDLWQQSLGLLEQIGDVKGKAATLHNMAGLIAQQGDVKRAMELWQQSLGLKEEIGDVQGKAATLHQMAGVIAEQGDVARAMELWQESLGLLEEIGDVKGRAATLHQMAGLIAQQGDVKRAMELWQESVDIGDQIGDVKGKAATLANMAWAAGQQGDAQRELELNLEAARALGAAQAWSDLVTVLGNLGAGDDADAVKYVAQAVWLLLRVTKSVEDSVTKTAGLLMKVGAESEAGLLVTAAGLYFAHTRGEKDPKQAEMQQLATGMAAACAAARNIEPERFPGWVQEEMMDAAVWLPKLEACLVELVGGDEGWLFDRELLPKLGVGGS
jgi:tetratricopeptide (TPR) repeat protein